MPLAVSGTRATRLLALVYTNPENDARFLRMVRLLLPGKFRATLILK
jgi:hypothetical protein